MPILNLFTSQSWIVHLRIANPDISTDHPKTSHQSAAANCPFAFQLGAWLASTRLFVVKRKDNVCRPHGKKFENSVSCDSGLRPRLTPCITKEVLKTSLDNYFTLLLDIWRNNLFCKYNFFELHLSRARIKTNVFNIYVNCL